MRPFSTARPHEAILQVGGERRADHPDRLDVPPSGAKSLEEPQSVAEERGHHVQLQLVDEPLSEVLPHGVRPAHDVDVPVSGGGLRLVEGAVDAPEVLDCAAFTLPSTGNRRIRHPRRQATAPARQRRGAT
jgi:hypothetical protein